MNKPMLTIRNNHVPECGAAPEIDTANDRRYFGYFANRFAEQWVFTFDRESGKATLRGGDLGWETTLPVRDGKARGAILNEPEQLWLKACWSAAAPREG